MRREAVFTAAITTSGCDAAVHRLRDSLYSISHCTVKRYRPISTHLGTLRMAILVCILHTKFRLDTMFGDMAVH